MPRYHVTAVYAEVIDQPQVYETEVVAEDLIEAEREAQLTCISDNTGEQLPDDFDLESYDGAYKLVDLAFHPVLDNPPIEAALDKLRVELEEATNEVQDDNAHWEDLASGQDTEEAEESGRLAGYEEGLKKAIEIIEGG